jgi:hypothetical protein
MSKIKIDIKAWFPQSIYVVINPTTKSIFYLLELYWDKAQSKKYFYISYHFEFIRLIQSFNIIFILKIKFFF